MQQFFISVVPPYRYLAQKRIILFHVWAVILLLINSFGTYLTTSPDYFLLSFSLLSCLYIITRGIILRKITRQNIKVIIGIRILIVCAFIIAALSWFRQQYYLIAVVQLLIGILYALLAVVEYRAQQPAILMMNEDELKVPGIIKPESYSWPQMNGVILRNDLLTLDFKNNRLLQLELADDCDEEAMREINVFCKMRISA